MKKIITLLAVLSMLFVLVGCGDDGMVSDIGSNVQSGIDRAEDKVESGMDNLQGGSVDNTNNNTNSASISREKAKSIAFEHAGVKEADAHDIDVDLENENNVSYYEVTFETKTFEYDYHINTDTGEIIYSSKENND